MSVQKETTLCTGCAMSCPLSVTRENGVLSVSGGACPKGALLYEQREKERAKQNELRDLFFHKLEKLQS